MSYTFQKGETINFGLEAVQGDIDDVISVVAKMQHNQTGAIFSLTVTENEDPAGWLFSADSTEMPLGEYTADATLVVGLNTIIADPVMVKLTPSISGV